MTSTAELEKQVHAVHYHHGTSTDEVLTPTLMTLSDGRYYRKMMDISFGKARETSTTRTMDWAGGAVSTSVTPMQYNGDDCYDEGEDNGELEGVESLPVGRGYTLKMDIPSNFYKYIIGRKGCTMACIERETKCIITVPQRGATGHVVLESNKVSHLADAKRRLEIIMWSNRLREPVSHFISIPLNHPVIMGRVNEFRGQVLATYSKDTRITEDVFQDPAKMHLTIGVMRLFSKEDEEKAKSVLEMCIIKARECLGNESVLIMLSGLDCMKDDPTSVDVLYANVLLKDSSDRLQRFVDTIVNCFLENAPDLMTNEFERTGVKLHATLMNSRFRGYGAQGHRPNQVVGPKGTFNATRILKEFSDYQFGEVPLEHVHLSKRGEYGPDGFYKCIKLYSIETITCG